MSAFVHNQNVLETHDLEPNSLALERNGSTRVKQILRESCGRLEIVQKLMLITYAMMPASNMTSGDQRQIIPGIHR